MSNRVIVIFDHDLIGYPPTLTLINILNSLGKEVVFIGVYSDLSGKEKLQNKGVQFIDLDCMPNFKVKSFVQRQLSILYNLVRYKKQIKKILYSLNIDRSDVVWFIYSNHAAIIYKLFKNFRYYVQFYEFVDARPHGLLKFLSRGYKPSLFLQKAEAVIHCEYNRASIMNGYYGVTGKMIIIPNKPEIDETLLNTIPNDISNLFASTKDKIRGRKAILYQGMFNSKERRLDEFCEASSQLPQDYVFIAMGGGKDWEILNKKYSSDKVLFIPFVKPPYHLLFTQIAWAGVLSYFPVNSSLQDVINPLYCAPNKIFEYAKYKKPMISNDIPALRQTFDKFNCGIVIDNPINSKSIIRAVLLINEKYKQFSEGAETYYNSVDVRSLVNNLLS